MEIASISAAAGILTKLIALTTALGRKVPAAVREQILALSGRILDIQKELFAAQQREIDLTDEKRGLEDKLRLMNDWNEEKKRYELKLVGDIAIVCTLRPQFQEGDPPHWLCANCFQDGKKSHLEAGIESLHFSQRRWSCPRCTSGVLIDFDLTPQVWAMGR